MPSTADKPTETTTIYSKIAGRVKLIPDSGSSGGEQTLPLSAFQASFVVNMIPTAHIVIPVGKSVNLEKEEEVIRARELSEQLKQFQKIEVYLTIEGEFAPGADWPAEEIKVFNGYVTGTSTTRSTGVISVLVMATHWLMDLDASSALSDEITSGSPLSFRLPPTGASLGSTITDPSDPSLVKFSSDLWVSSLKEKFKILCKAGSIIRGMVCKPSTDTRLIAQTQLTNDIALPRLEDKANGRFDDTSKIDVPKIALVPQLGLTIKGTISQSVNGKIFNGSTGHSTLWEKLEEIARLFEVTIIPTVDSATVVPMSPCLVGDDVPRQVTIKANEYYSLKPSEPTFRVWRGVSIIGQDDFQLGSVDTDDSQAKLATFGSSGCYIADEDADLPQDYRDRAVHGTLQFMNAPDWVQDSSMKAALAMPATLPKTAVNGSPNHTMEDIEATANFVGPPAPAGADPTNPNVRDDDAAKSLGDLYAKWYYWTHQFLARTGNISGKLRFDIAPGSIVRIEDLDGKLYEDPAEFGYLYALVTSVQVTVDAVHAQASTAFTISHIRRESEKKHGTERHPLYQERWVGTVLQNVPINVSNPSSGVFVPRPTVHELA